MVAFTYPVAPSPSCLHPGALDELCERVRAEFREMPGLKLTLAQAARFFSVEPALCQEVLEALVHDGQLVTDGRMFARPDNWRRNI